ncbi:MAG: hypothetical protein DRP92_00085 [Candidatus Neomarinimicrobiota bacterium]|nr:small multi-drug export protein [Candidatus Neomarinimicrobiota bacterium]MCD6100553.1 small multi-drug export protein [Candidatus Neomarinimicrobiota bacterium]RKY54806.1 MAG: hypothetical protein DRP92_00085 [Candidatus Neomarinimicrobiota bacterium]
MAEIIKLIGITFIPALELRASIPYGIFATSLNWIEVFGICVLANIILGLLVYQLLETIIRLLIAVKPLRKLWELYVDRTQRRIKRGVDKYGEWAVMVFIAIPLPGSGVYTGALASFLIGLSFRKFLIANIFGVLIAGVLVTLACLTGAEALRIFIKTISG